ncbi:G1/S-specific cyclin-E1-like [Sycon ciliatum]|uniref:G1/S-specific cyclin-E1-like n=1 Tax=Sycon ciliatum TaxID=27933 RepID=UPI0020AC5FD6|eukprot:scpid14669/ scgid25671/ G1/S-specific cyclin-E1
MEVPRGRSRRGRSPAVCSSSSTRRPATRSTTRVVAKAVPMEHLEHSLREAALRTCATPAASTCSFTKRKSRTALAAIGQNIHSITPPSSGHGTPEASSFRSGNSDPAESKQLESDLMYPTPPPTRLFASGTLRECCCHSQTNVSTFEALHQLRDVLVKRERNYDIDQNYLNRHAMLEARMRRILFDWLMEVCEVMVLRRETFHLAVNLFDRYMSLKRDIHKESLQLIGVTCLFVAGKLEEIYPPKASAFAYVTDHLHEDEIRAMELDVLVTVKFRVNAVTPNTWVAFWMLYMHTEDVESTSEYDSSLFVRVMELIDLAICDVACLLYPNRILALAAFFVVTKNWSLPASLGFHYKEVQSCAEWLTSYYAIMNLHGSSSVLRTFEEVPENEALNIQDHKYSFDDFVSGRDGPKQPLESPKELHTPTVLAPKSLGFNRQSLTPDYLTPSDQMSEET